MTRDKIIVTGANGQVGTELVSALRKIHGNSNVIATDIDQHPTSSGDSGPFEYLNVLDQENLRRLLDTYRPREVYHLAALLSAVGEKKPQKAWELNMDGLLHMLRLSLEFEVEKVFWPSSIAVFGPLSPKENTPQHCIMNPDSIYGISKLAGERWCEYYALHHGLDVRSLRFPGLIGWQSEPGGGTTDYAVHIFHEALKNQAYDCFLTENTRLPMMSMPDAIRATVELMQAEKEKISIRSSYNIAGINFTPGELAAAIRKHIPGFRISYLENDPRQKIADSWPESIDDSFARSDWNWEPGYDLPGLTSAMLENISRNRTFVHDL
ncbi:nucleoside-diphosphate-sugar epimerase [Anseongella ginsenosidimutans]|uniref:Nucleoside-diphosphate-sugar epimerase n=1 Tax=Anseongella ginsenosidimutans TaxID=496056 RepID=A0A4R3KM73_9SPHI|nr:NAD-dependent epimerase/dehydratase family protein [Anseongella ginsenosidimutans]QEC52486.1 NAD-dependent epimerase/dehydratase family protein [Anseongella ginsenosidimutans]TCS85335.1 nucleoside-diphosphate-sugar epimerase [Anseongella ginsenosidimutans]